MNFEKRMGRLSLSLELLRYEPKKVMKMFEEVLVIKSECMPHKGTYEYHALSEHFRELDEGEDVPKYDICLYENGRVVFKELK